jgi:hypothetical protein
VSMSEDAIRRLAQSRNKMLAAMNAPEASSSTAALALAAGNMMVKPTVQRHPLTTVVVAAVIGAVLYKSRPWRLITNPVLLSMLAPLAISKIGLLSPSTEPVLLKGFDLYRQFVQHRSKPKTK